MMLYIKRTEYRLEWKSSNTSMATFGDWIFSIVYENNPKNFYFGLTLFGIFVTIQKTKKTLKDINHG